LVISTRLSRNLRVGGRRRRAARELVARDGYEATYLAAVAAHANVTRVRCVTISTAGGSFEAVFTREVEGCHLCETAMVVARADDQKAAHRQAVGEIGTVLAGLAISA
jgi:hypothetical protein